MEGLLLSLYRLVCKYLHRHIDSQAIPGSIQKVLRLQGIASPLPVGAARLPGPLGGLHLLPGRVTRYPAARMHLRPAL